MIGRMRWWLAPAVVVLCGASCEKDRRLTCEASVANYCAAATSGCALTWDDAALRTAFCDGTQAPPLRIECGTYHALMMPFVDFARTYYYDLDSGMLVAILTAFAKTSTTTCTAGPAAGFTPPVCAGAVSEPLPQCLDGGADTAAP
jgi:hypothetical protein